MKTIVRINVEIDEDAVAGLLQKAACLTASVKELKLIKSAEPVDETEHDACWRDLTEAKAKGARKPFAKGDKPEHYERAEGKRPADEVVKTPDEVAEGVRALEKRHAFDQPKRASPDGTVLLPGKKLKNLCGEIQIREEAHDKAIREKLIALGAPGGPHELADSLCSTMLNFLASLDRLAKPKPEPKAEPKPKERRVEPKPSPGTGDGETLEEEDKVTVREMVGERQAIHGAAIRAKLATFGVENVSGLKKEHLGEIVEFLEALPTAIEAITKPSEVTGPAKGNPPPEKREATHTETTNGEVTLSEIEGLVTARAMGHWTEVKAIIEGTGAKTVSEVKPEHRQSVKDQLLTLQPLNDDQ